MTGEFEYASEAVAAHGGSVQATCRALGIPRSTLRNRLAAEERQGRKPHHPTETLTIPQAPSEDESIEELIARKVAQVTRIEASRKFHKLVNIGVKDEGPIIIAAIGDPHTDDDRCDIGQLIADMRLIGRTKHMHALHLGDITNNWVGRLGRLYAHQRTTAGDGIRLAEEVFRLAPPLAVVAGNHDLWNEGMSWLNFCARQAGVDAKIVQAHGVRLSLDFPGGKSIRLHARHDFPGHSQYNNNHGLQKEHLFGQRDHVNIAGHKHTSSVTGAPSPEGYIHWTYRVEGYKLPDDFAAGLNLREMRMGPTVALLIDPGAKNPAELIKPFWDLEVAADYLKFKRARKAA